MMPPMLDELEKLLDLQNKDLALLEADTRLAEIADEVSNLDRVVEAAEREAEAADTRLAEGVKRREEIEVRIESYRTIQDRRRQRLEEAKGVREAQALLTEVEMARTVLVREEAEWVRAAERVTELENAVKEASDKIAALKEEQAPSRGELASEESKLTDERSEALTARNAAAKQVDREIRQRYDRLRSARNTAVVVALRGDACGACFTAVPRNRRSQIRAGLLLDNCEACGVLLYAEVEESV